MFEIRMRPVEMKKEWSRRGGLEEQPRSPEFRQKVSARGRDYSESRAMEEKYRRAMDEARRIQYQPLLSRSVDRPLSTNTYSTTDPPITNSHHRHYPSFTH